MLQQALTTILGGMIMDSEFRTQMQNDIDETLTLYKITLTPAQREGLTPIVEKFRTGDLDPCVNTFLSNCPQWPCFDMLMIIPPEGEGPLGARKSAKQPPVKHVRPSRKKSGKKTSKKTSGRKTAGKRKKSSRR